MSFVKFLLVAATIINVLLVAFASIESHAQYRGRVGSSAALRGRSGLPPVGRRPSPRATIIPNRSGGFDMYSPRGNSRYLGKAQGNKVFHPDGTSSTVIPDNTGGLTVYGPQGTHRVFPEKDSYTDE